MIIPTGFVAVMVILSGVLGLVVGSFLNVVVFRVPNGQSIVSPPSACPQCSVPIKPYDNVPVVSWIVLRGRCRTCRKPISPRYPLVELGTALFFGAVTWGFLSGWVPSGASAVEGAGPSVGAALVVAAFLYLAAISVSLALIDLDTHRLPNALVLPSYIAGIGFLALASAAQGDFTPLLGGAIGLAALWTVYFVLALVYPGGMGFGDVKLSGVLGLYLGYLGWGELAVGAFAAFLLGGLFAVGLLLTGRATRSSGIPFGPWMLAGAWAGIFFGDRVWHGYLALFGGAF
jgi:leader peptidase (prepilin peptidase)/N-methyltransferase